MLFGLFDFDVGAALIFLFKSSLIFDIEGFGIAALVAVSGREVVLSTHYVLENVGVAVSVEVSTAVGSSSESVEVFVVKALDVVSEQTSDAVAERAEAFESGNTGNGLRERAVFTRKGREGTSDVNVYVVAERSVVSVNGSVGFYEVSVLSKVVVVGNCKSVNTSCDFLRVTVQSPTRSVQHFLNGNDFFTLFGDGRQSFSVEVLLEVAYEEYFERSIVGYGLFTSEKRSRENADD